MEVNEAGFRSTGASWRPVRRMVSSLNLWSGVFSVILFARLPAFAAAPIVHFEIIARTGTTTPAGNTITALGNGPSINTHGDVAYVLQIADGRQGVFVSGESSARSGLIDTFRVGGFTFSDLSQNFYFPDVLQINNQGQIAWRVWSRDGLFSFIFRLGRSSADFRVVAKTRYDRVDTPQEDLPSPFCGPFLTPTTGLSPAVSLNNVGRPVFSGIQCSTENRYVLATPRNVESSEHDFATDFYISPPLLNVSNFFPQIADNNTVIVRGGRPTTSPIMLFVEPALDPNVAAFVATSTDFNALGERPGISDNGTVVAFMGDHKTQGVGIFCSIINVNHEVLSGPFRITGFPGFSAFIDRARVGVNRWSYLGSSHYAIAYLAFGSPGQPGPLGFYLSVIDVANSHAPTISPPLLITRVGQTIPGLADPVQNIAIYDPINSNGQLAFWVTTTSDVQAIIRATVKQRPDIKGFIRFRDGTPMRNVRVSLLDRNSTEHAAVVSSADGSYAIPFPVAAGPGQFFIRAATVGSRASRITTEGELPDHEGEAVNWFTDGTIGPYKAETHMDPFERPDLILNTIQGNLEVTGGDAIDAYRRQSVDIYFPQPIVWVHGIFSKASRYIPQYRFFSHPDSSIRQVIECSLSYFVDTLMTKDLGNLDCPGNAGLVDEYMRSVYDVGIANIVADWPNVKPKFNLVAHSMGAPISRIWECAYNASRQHGDVNYYLSISGIHGGNYAASFYTAQWRKPASWIKAGESAAGCAVSRIFELNQRYFEPHGKYLFAWGINGGPTGLSGFFTDLGWRELKPHDGVNNAPSATSQNGPYQISVLGFPVIDWVTHPDSNRDLRLTKFGVHVREKPKRMGYVDFAEVADEQDLAERVEFGDHSFMDSATSCMTSYATWLDLSSIPGNDGAYQETQDYARWPDPHFVPVLDQRGMIALKSSVSAVEETALIATFADDLIHTGQTHRYDVPVDGCAEVRFNVVWNYDCALVVRLQTPTGEMIDPSGTNSSNRYRSTAYSQESNAEAEYAITSPSAGLWKLIVEAANDVPVAGVPFLVHVSAMTDLLLLQHHSSREIAPDGRISVQAIVSRANQPIAGNLSLTGRFTRPDEQSMAFPLYDDGLHQDGAAGDGLFGAEISNTSISGEYGLTLTASGTNDNNQIFQRVGASAFAVTSLKAKLTGSVQEMAVDTDSSGRYDELRVALGIVVTQASTFLVSAELSAASQLLDSAVREVQLTAGAHTIELVFDGTRVGQSRIDGPYTISAIRLEEITGRSLAQNTNALTALIGCDQSDALISTRPYAFWEFDRADPKPVLLIADPLGDGALRLLGKIGAAYRIEASEDLLDWSVLTVVTGARSPVVIVDSMMNQTRQRFYRAIAMN